MLGEEYDCSQGLPTPVGSLGQETTGTPDTVANVHKRIWLPFVILGGFFALGYAIGTLRASKAKRSVNLGIGYLEKRKKSKKYCPACAGWDVAHNCGIQ